MLTSPASANITLAVLLDTVMDKTDENDVLFPLDGPMTKLEWKGLKDVLVEYNTFCVHKHLENIKSKFT